MKMSLKSFFLIVAVCAFAICVVAQGRKTPPKTEGAKPAASDTGSEAKSSEAKPADSKPKDPLDNMRFRNLGPAVGGGRVSAVAGVPGKPNLYYAGAAGGGVWVTQDGGLSWKAIFDKQSTASIGAIALAPSNPSLIWVGTGESNPRNDVITGRGIFFSPDAGTTWNFMGLMDVGQISNIVIDPRDPNTVYVGVLGHLWGPNSGRGVFRTKDGGKNWQKVLYVDDTTGVSSLIMDPGNPLVLFAGMWPLKRFPWMLESGGTTGGVFRSLDGGSTWKKLTEGLPEGATGRVGLDAAPSNPRHIYALVESKTGVLWDSNDLGDHWKMVSNNHNLNARPFYFSQLVVSPKDENKVYFLSFGIMLSEDGGKTARTLGQRVHPDHHSMWIDPENPDRMINGNDGGVYISSDAGRTWRYLDNLPIEQFYSVAQDDQTPYNLCGGLQDNNGWCGPSNSLSRGGITGADWITAVGGDGEYIVPARGVDTHIVYADSQNGSIQRLNAQNGLNTSIRPYSHGVQYKKPADLKYRFNWTSPIGVSYTDPNEVYIGGNVLFKSTDGGAHWNAISPDLTRNDKTKQETSGGAIWYDISGAETFGTILSFSISPLDAKIIWAGTDDGQVQVTTDGGQHWSNVTANIPGLPQWGRLQQIEASPIDAASAYIAVDFHEVDNNKPYAYKTHDGGKTWTSIAEGLPQEDPARVVREDPNHKGFLAAGTDTGVFYSTDDGGHWAAMKNNFPTAPVYDIKFVKKSHDLVVATHGRGLFVLDDITPLEETTHADLAKSEFHVFTPLTAVNWHNWNKRGFTSGGYVAPNPPNGGVITYSLPAEIKITPEMRRRNRTPVKIAISDSSGKVVRTMYGPARFGVNRVVWNLRYDGPKRLTFLGTPPERDEEDFFFDPNTGPMALPGSYKVAVTYSGKTETQTIQVENDPRFQHDAAAQATQQKVALEMRDQVSALNDGLNRLANLHKQITAMQEMLGGGDGQEGADYRPVLEAARALDKKITTLQNSLYNTDIQPFGQDNIHYLQRFHDNLQGLMREVMQPYGEAPKSDVVEEAAELRKDLDTHLKEINDLLANDVATFNKMSTEHGASTLFTGKPVEIKSGASGESGEGEEIEEMD